MLQLLERLRLVAVPMANGKVKKLDYLSRTRIERNLFLVLSRYLCGVHGVEIDGFAEATWNEVFAQNEETMSSDDREILVSARRAYVLVRRLTSSNTYYAGDAEHEDGRAESGHSNSWESDHQICRCCQCRG